MPRGISISRFIRACLQSQPIERRFRKLSIELLERRETAIAPGLAMTGLAQVLGLTGPAETRPELPALAALTLAPALCDALLPHVSPKRDASLATRIVRKRLASSATE